ncbi:hypothetical protein [Flammeovirga aprica]|uniref:Uncharacterized protein n=1 Tax=Flammeovirga aprica JL-4 TaxID=694437 RepID=A0A7X9RZG1_9BACT|nr:hypothetical protein [Flammeovirga aprica]NME71551.1 hypothetical protein [Flammeovirga aprica JL-4]
MKNKLFFLMTLLFCLYCNCTYAQNEISWTNIFKAYQRDVYKPYRANTQLTDSKALENLNLPFTKDTEIWCNSIYKICDYETVNFGLNNKYELSVFFRLYQYNANIIIFGGIIEYSRIPGFFIFYRKENILIFLGGLPDKFEGANLPFQDIFLLDSHFDVCKRIVLDKDQIVYKTEITEYPRRKELLFIPQKKIDIPSNLKTLLPLLNDNDYWQGTGKNLFPNFSYHPMWLMPMVTYEEEPHGLNYIEIEEEEK